MRARGPIRRSDWLKSLGVLAAWAAIGVAAPNVLGADKNSTNAFTPAQMGPFRAAHQDPPADQGVVRSTSA
ncbi:hypothetical protein [Actinoplanes sp. NPDC051411]|uniref:hypothetical protein n=1 Tax=Actinoplanes sp. NPDC051411 TaxID=3155522 RepID=UPI00342497B4